MFLALQKLKTQAYFDVPSMKHPWAPSILLLIVLPSMSVASGFSGLIVSVPDGDVLDIQYEHGIERVRLNGIDAPEKGQAYGRHARQFMEEMALGKHVIIETRGQDKHERTIGEVFLLDGRHLNKELVKAGLAWWFCRHASDAELKQLEEEAREADRGLWKDPMPIPPWVYRQLQHKPVPEVSDFDCPGPIIPADTSARCTCVKGCRYHWESAQPYLSPSRLSGL
jgi:micrococcal nuclease